ncbi:cobalamin B12-binding domain-containing protein [Chloroflexota bacterium]
MDERRVKVLMAKPGVDGHWRGMSVICTALRDAGMEVVYGGNMPPPHIANAAAQEDVDVVGLSIMTGNPMIMVSDTMDELKSRGKGNILLIVGGIIPEDDIPDLKKLGASAVFLPGTPLKDIVGFVRDNASVAK